MQNDPHDLIALDRLSSRVFDQDGHLHVASANISKANVCGYYGKEIPDYEALGLDPDQIYQLFRDPEELAKAVDTFNGKPLLFDHKPVSAEDHDHDMTVGSVTNARYVAPYLKADLSVWSGSAIKSIQDGSQKELSSAYRYRAVMQSGTYQGARYDGRMTDIACNHVALVSKGRAGSDVVVGDSLENFLMAKIALTGAGAQTQGALAVYLKPKLAMDAKIDLAPIVTGLTAKNYKSRTTKMVADLKALTAGKLAQDVDIDDAIEVLEALAPILPPDVVEEVAEEVADTTEPTDEITTDDDPTAVEACIEMCRKLDPEDMAKVMAAMNDMSNMAAPAMDETGKDKKDMVTKPAMDAAIAAAVKAATANATKTQRDIREAERAVRPRVGDLAMAHDSAEGVYRTALKSLNVAVDGVPDSALKALYHAIPDAPARTKPVLVAQDAAAIAEASTAFPHMTRLGA